MWFSGVMPLGGEGVDHHDGRDGEQADGLGVALGDLGGDRRVVGGVGREVDDLEVDVDELGHLLDLGGDELQRGRVGQDQQEVVGARGLGGGDAGHADGDAGDRRVGVRVGELEGRGAEEEDARAGRTPWRRRRRCRSW